MTKINKIKIIQNIPIGIIIEYMDRGSLEFMLDDHLEVSEAVMAAIVYQILWGLGYLHYDNRLVS